MTSSMDEEERIMWDIIEPGKTLHKDYIPLREYIAQNEEGQKSLRGEAPRRGSTSRERASRDPGLLRELIAQLVYASAMSSTKYKALRVILRGPSIRGPQLLMSQLRGTRVVKITD